MIQPYFQTTPFTTAASSLLTILHYFDNSIKLSKETEFDIWQKSVNLPTRASSIYGLANYAKEKGIECQIIIEKKEYSYPDYRFYRYTKEEVEQAAFSAKIHRKNARENNIHEEEREIIIDEIKTKLVQNNILMLRLNTKPIRQGKRNSSNYIIIHGYSNPHFHCIDPALGAISISEETFTQAFESLKEKKHRGRRMLVFKKV